MTTLPPIARIASLIGDPARARMLSALMDGRSRTAGELAREATITPQTASSHLAKLVEGDLLVIEKQGRHRYHRLASAEVAHALEAMLVVSAARPSPAIGWGLRTPGFGARVSVTTTWPARSPYNWPSTGFSGAGSSSAATRGS
ncbi:helix-turn-helix transcriptional regulator [Stenotrophomonas sp.]|uniref:ArsR/SmtB family transcription factor n=1 Tax=Stenotrophomonas sp. TaxID=69392 RepID=UPI0029AE4233|nr:helix-turn-helix transcriptional regulator [Stenotrophomonas sp.]MDX3935630.1 helix-turn-helix transcriptional regulator [Stenotrophomonas sp.]